MNERFKVIAAGAAVGFLESFSIWFVPEEPYASFIVGGGTLKGVLTALLVTSFVDGRSSVGRALGMGALAGLLMSAVVFFAKGGWASWDAAYVVPFGVVGGAVLGLLVRRLDVRAVP